MSLSKERSTNCVKNKTERTLSERKAAPKILRQSTNQPHRLCAAVHVFPGDVCVCVIVTREAAGHVEEREKPDVRGQSTAPLCADAIGQPNRRVILARCV